MTSKNSKASKAKVPVCGLMMPISGIDSLPASHWADVRSILEEVAKKAGFVPRMVSESDETNVIHKNIIENLYTDDICICDVSGLNPNVMFELGMRLAFDKPTVLIKDDGTRFSFDTSPIQHVQYRRDLRFQDMRKFMDDLDSKLKATHEAYTSNSEYSPFLKSFGTFKVPKMDTENVSLDEYVVEQLNAIRTNVSKLSQKVSSLDTARLSNPLLDSATLNALASNALISGSSFEPSNVSTRSGGLNALSGISTEIKAGSISGKD